MTGFLLSKLILGEVHEKKTACIIGSKAFSLVGGSLILVIKAVQVAVSDK